MKKLFNLIHRTSRKRIQFTGMEFLYWATFAALSFQIVFLKERGLSNTTVGTIMAVVACARIFSQPLWGIVSDRIRSVKKVYIFCLAVSAIFFVFLPFFKSALLICPVLLLFTFFSSPLTPLLDSWVVQGISDSKEISYGSLRLWGSIGYAVMTYACGKLIDSTSVNIIFLVYFVMALFTIFFSINVEDERAAKQITLKEMKLGRLFTNYYYIVFLLFAFFLNIPKIASMTFLPNLVEQLGGSKEQLGMMFSLSALSETPVFFFGGYLIKRFGSVKLLIFAGILYIFQQFLYLSALKTWHVVLGQLVGGSGFSFFLLGMIHYVYVLTPDELKSTGQTLASSFSMGLSAIVANYVGGLIIDHLGINYLYRFGAVNNIIIVGLFFLSFPLGKRLSALTETREYLVCSDFKTKS